MSKLIFIGEKFKGRTYEISAQRTTVGRGDANTLSIHDGSVSERHCEIYDNGEDLIIRDLGSRNGTVVNGELLRGAQRPLAHGQTVIFGTVEARLDITAPATSDTLTDVTAVHFHAHHATPAKPAANPGATLDAGGPPATGDQTLLLSRPAATPAPTSPTPVPAASAPPRNKTVLIIMILLAAIVLGWWLFLR